MENGVSEIDDARFFLAPNGKMMRKVNFMPLSMHFSMTQEMMTMQLHAAFPQERHGFKSSFKGLNLKR